MKSKLTKTLGIVMANFFAGTMLFAANLTSEKLIVTDLAAGKKVTEATDNDLSTAWNNSGKGLIVDLGKDTMVHRIYINPGTDVKDQVQSVKISFLQKPDEPNPAFRNFILPKCEGWQVAEQRWKLLASGTDDILPVRGGRLFYKEGPPKIDVNLKFNPAKARYLRIEGPAKIAELEIYGSSDPAAFEKKDAVVLPANAPQLLRIAAEDLRYYIGELSGRPLPIITPEKEKEYSGTLYKIEDLKSLAPDYPTMLANLKSGKLPTGGPLPETVVSLHTMRLPDGVNVERDGRVVSFRAWPYRNVLYSVWEFLRRQGVVWTYPDDHGDYVPAGKGVDLGILPLKYRPSADWRFARFGMPDLHLYPDTEAFLFFVRCGYGSPGDQAIDGFLDQHKEVPPIPAATTQTKEQVKPEYAEGGFSVTPHNFNGVLPDRILEQHPDWCGMTADGKRLPPNKGGPSTFCMTSPGAIQFTADKILDWVGPNKECRVKFNLLPMDGCKYCQCEECQKMYKPYVRPDIPWVPGMNYMVSDAYYHFVSEVAKRVGAKAPNVRIGALAYADVLTAPRKIEKLPDNVWVEVCQYGSRNLPMSNPANDAVRQLMENWSMKCKNLEVYEYQLIEGEWMELPMLLPSVAAISDRSKFLYKLGAWNGGSQSGSNPFPHNPWNHYAYAKMLWDVNQTPEQMLKEFFDSYYGEAAGPMLAYYKVFEDHIIKNNIDLQNFGYDQGPNPDAFSPEIVASMQKNLDQAKQTAKSWVVKQRVEQAQKDLDWSVPASLRRSMDKTTAIKYGKKEYVCGQKKGEISIDGKLDEEDWKAAPVATGFIKPKTHEIVSNDAQSEFRMLWDDENLYVAVKCQNPKIAELKETDAIWGGKTDSIELFLVPENTYTATYYQTAVSAFNKIMNPIRCFHDQWHKDTEWKGDGIKTAVQRGDGFWTCEIAVPFRMLKEGAPKAGDSWRSNIARNYPAVASSWSPLQFGAWGLYRDFNFITFAGK